VNRRQTTLGLVAAFCVGVALRTWPLWHSPLPFNPDGIIYASLVQETVRTGHFPLGRMAVDELAFTAFLATISHVTGMHALYHSQGFIAVVGTVPVLLVALLANRMAPQVGLQGSARRYAVVLGALVFAVEGLSLHRSMPVDEQTIGLFLVPLGLVAIAYAISRHRRWWVVAVPVLLVVPAVHNLDAFVLALALTLLAVFAIDHDRLGSPRTLGIVAVGFWAYFAAYNYGVELLTPATIIQQTRLTAVPDLVLAWLVLTAIGSRWFTGRTATTKRTLLASVLLAWFGVLAANALAPIFPGLPTTNQTILYGIAPLVILVALFSYVLPRALEATDGVVLFAQLAAVVALVGISLSAALTADYLNTLYRVQTFAHLPVVTVAALGTGSLIGMATASLPGTVESRRFSWPNPRTFASALALLVLLASVASIPIAYGGLDVLTYKGVTTPAEFGATGFADRHVPGAWTSDDHLTRMTPYYSPSSSGSVQPTYAYLTGSDPPGCPMLTQRSWTTIGAQLYPRSSIQISTLRYRQYVVERNAVYHSGSTDAILLLVAPTEKQECAT